jgi:hypothetical protein
VQTTHIGVPLLCESWDSKLEESQDESWSANSSKSGASSACRPLCLASARYVDQDLSHSRVGGALGQLLAIIRTISAHRGGKHSAITVSRLSDAKWSESSGAFPSETRTRDSEIGSARARCGGTPFLGSTLLP